MSGTDEIDGLAAKVRGDFPILEREIRGHRLAYLDSGASSQHPVQVIDAMDRYYRWSHANIHRGAHTLGDEATAAYDGARERVTAWIGAADPAEVIFGKNVTEMFNLVARSWGGANLAPGDRIVVSLLEHHANIVPWFQVAERCGAVVEWIPLCDDGTLDMAAAQRLLDGAKVLAVTAASNVTAAMPDVTTLCGWARDAGAVSVVDAAQFAPHVPLDVATLGADFVGFTGHKLLGPTGIGVLWGRRELLDAMPPFLGGGEMIADVTTDGFTCAPLPLKFEAGTMPIAEAVGLHAAIDYLDAVGLDVVRAHDVAVSAYAMAALRDRFGSAITMYGPDDPAARGGLIAFTLADVHPHDLSTILDSEGVAIRAGHHCAKPLHKHLGVTATARASFYLYTSTADIDQLVAALGTAAQMFGVDG